jgi:hypothetical protein
VAYTSVSVSVKSKKGSSTPFPESLSMFVAWLPSPFFSADQEHDQHHGGVFASLLFRVQWLCCVIKTRCRQGPWLAQCRRDRGGMSLCRHGNGSEASMAFCWLCCWFFFNGSLC